MTMSLKKIVLTAVLVFATCPSADAQYAAIRRLDVTPSTVHFERVDDAMRLSCEVGFENRGSTLRLAAWRLEETAEGRVSTRPGDLLQFWCHARFFDAVNRTETTALHAGSWRGSTFTRGDLEIPERTRVIFCVPFPTYAKNQLPSRVAVVLVLSEPESKRTHDVRFDFEPRAYEAPEEYVFPMGYEFPLRTGREFAVRDWAVPRGILHGGGHEQDTEHRRRVSWPGGWDKPLVVGQRFAYDFHVRDASGYTHGVFPAGEERWNSHYFIFRQRVYAVADGVVARVTRDVEDNIRAGMRSSNPRDALGNYIVLEHRGGVLSSYRHLRFRSIPAHLKPGTKVFRGQVIGDVGNSGSSLEPHLHFQMQWNGEAEGEGVPVGFSNVEVRRWGLGTNSEEPRFIPWRTGIPSGSDVRVVRAVKGKPRAAEVPRPVVREAPKPGVPSRERPPLRPRNPEGRTPPTPERPTTRPTGTPASQGGTPPSGRRNPLR